MKKLLIYKQQRKRNVGKTMKRRIYQRRFSGIIGQLGL